MDFSQPNEEPSENSPFQDLRTRNIGLQPYILQLNIEGISKAKSDYLTKLLHIYNIDVLLLEKLHTADEPQLRSRGIIPVYILAAATYDRRYGSATYIKYSISNWNLIHKSVVNDISTIIVNVSGILVHYTYKPPATD